MQFVADLGGVGREYDCAVELWGDKRAEAYFEDSFGELGVLVYEVVELGERIEDGEGR